jgi:hypothetical protein
MGATMLTVPSRPMHPLRSGLGRHPAGQLVVHVHQLPPAPVAHLPGLRAPATKGRHLELDGGSKL